MVRKLLNKQSDETPNAQIKRIFIFMNIYGAEYFFNEYLFGTEFSILLKTFSSKPLKLP